MGRAFHYLALGCIKWCLLLPAALAVAEPPGSGAPAGKPQILIANLRRSGLNMLWLPATVENVKGSFIIDTGSGVTLLSDSKYQFLLKGDAHRLPPGAHSTIPVNNLRARTALMHALSLGGHDLGGSLVALVPARYLDEGMISHDASRASSFDGIVGEDFLRHYQAVIDCTRQRLYLNLGAPTESKLPGVLVPNGWTRVQMSYNGSHFVVPCVLKGLVCRLIVDTGSPFTTLDQALLRSIKVGSHTLAWQTALIGNDYGPELMAHLHTLQIGDYTANDVEMTAMEHLSASLASEPQRTSDAPIVGVLGADTLGFNSAIIDLGGQAIYLKHLPAAAKKP